MNKRKLLTYIFIMCAVSLFAQNHIVTGTVISASDSSPIPGVTVQVKGTTTGTVTDLDGYYKIAVDPNGILVFSFVGMQAIETSVNNRSLINVVMQEEKIDLGEVVVVGYSTSSRKLISNSVEVVKTEELQNAPIRTIDGVLQGKVAGVSVSMSSGTPGGQNSIKMRGEVLSQPVISR